VTSLVPLLPLAHAAYSSLSPLEQGIVIVAGLIAAWSIWKAVSLTLHPGEQEPDHLKRMILDEPAPGAPLHPRHNP
jgi:hypothetical protein